MREGVDLWTLSQSLLQSLLEPEIRSRPCVLEGSQGSVLSEWSDHRPGHPREGRPLLGTDSPHTHPCHSPRLLLLPPPPWQAGDRQDGDVRLQDPLC